MSDPWSPCTESTTNVYRLKAKELQGSDTITGGAFADDNLSILTNASIAGTLNANNIICSSILATQSTADTSATSFTADKYLGNKILTKLQNMLLGTKLSEFHSGYRVYSVESLNKIPFDPKILYASL